MLLIHLEVPLVEVILCLGVQLAEATLHAADPLPCVMIARVPEVFPLPMPLVHVELTLIVAVFEDHAPVSVLVALRPVAFVEVATLDGDAVAETIPPIRNITPLTLIEISSSRSSHGSKGPFVEVQERNGTIVEVW